MILFDDVNENDFIYLYKLWLTTKLEYLQLHDKTSEEVNECIHSFIYPLGRRHHVYGPNVIQVELLGLLMAKSLLTFIPIDKVGDQKFEDITHAFFSFFKVIVYWLKFGLNQQKRLSLQDKFHFICHYNIRDNGLNIHKQYKS